MAVTVLAKPSASISAWLSSEVAGVITLAPGGAERLNGRFTPSRLSPPASSSSPAASVASVMVLPWAGSASCNGTVAIPDASVVAFG